MKEVPLSPAKDENEEPFPFRRTIQRVQKKREARRLKQQGRGDSLLRRVIVTREWISFSLSQEALCTRVELQIFYLKIKQTEHSQSEPALGNQLF